MLSTEYLHAYIVYAFGLAACTPAENEDSDGKSVSETTMDELKSAVLVKETQAGDQQIHVWIGFGEDRIQGYVHLWKLSDAWSGRYCI